MHKYEGDTTICQKCGHVHHLMDEIPIFCEACNHDMRIVLSPEQEACFVGHLDTTYKKTKVDDLK